MEAWVSRYQWQFWFGWSNDFDFIRISLTWMDHETVKFKFVFFGFELNLCFRAHSMHHVRRKFDAWWYPCSTCGKRFGKHDDSKEHLPF